ncbi:MAG: hypothetical protein ACXAB2_06720 [Candidatus Hodarchaeales archaeon]|jgi:hypothetical protein
MSKLPKIWGLMPYYYRNEIMEVAERSMQSICEKTVSDQGKWEEYPSNPYLMYDLIPEYKTEMEHRNYMISKVPTGDYFITWDSDLVFFGNHKSAFSDIKKKKPLTVFFNIISPNGHKRKHPMMFRKEQEMEYAINHHSIFVNNLLEPILFKYNRNFDEDYDLNFFDLGHLKFSWELEDKEIYKLKRKDNMNYREAFR